MDQHDRRQALMLDLEAVSAFVKSQALFISVERPAVLWRMRQLPNKRPGEFAEWGLRTVIGQLRTVTGCSPAEIPLLSPSSDHVSSPQAAQLWQRSMDSRISTVTAKVDAWLGGAKAKRLSRHPDVLEAVERGACALLYDYRLGKMDARTAGWAEAVWKAWAGWFTVAVLDKAEREGLYDELVR